MISQIRRIAEKLAYESLCYLPMTYTSTTRVRTQYQTVRTSTQTVTVTTTTSSTTSASASNSGSSSGGLFGGFVSGIENFGSSFVSWAESPRTQQTVEGVSMIVVGVGTVIGVGFLIGGSTALTGPMGGVLAFALAYDAGAAGGADLSRDSGNLHWLWR
ncbi:MAG: hypothetical protein ACRDF4_01020 [Rhabdochlamydiaceae bacterium]